MVEGSTPSDRTRSKMKDESSSVGDLKLATTELGAIVSKERAGQAQEEVGGRKGSTSRRDNFESTFLPHRVFSQADVDHQLKPIRVRVPSSSYHRILENLKRLLLLDTKLPLHLLHGTILFAVIIPVILPSALVCRTILRLALTISRIQRRDTSDSSRSLGSVLNACRVVKYPYR
jgi:hypothetical protein